jgi:hypothetical protein
MGAEHVVIRRDDGDIGLGLAAERFLVGGLAGGEAVGEVAARQVRPARRTLPVAADLVEVAVARIARALDDALGDFADAGVQRNHVHTSMNLGT